MPQLVISLFGQVQFVLRGQLLTDFESDKARALLIYLAMHAGRPHRREQLRAVFWSEQNERLALQNLRQTLHRLRQTLHQAEGSEQSSAFLIVTTQSVEFNTRSTYELDVNVFESLITGTQHHRHRRLETCRTCMDRLTYAAQLYRGDFLAGFSVKGSPEFDGWVALQRERLRIQAIDALNVLAAYHERRGDVAAARDYARRQLELEPWQESAHRQVMRALAREGRRAAALAQYKVCHRVLLAELGVEPEPETTALYERIRSAEMTVFSKKTVILNFPARLTSFVGRETELAQIGDTLQDPDCRLVTLIGPGGSGKTRLAVEAAKAEAFAFEDGACFVALAPLTSGALIPSAIASALDISLLATQDVKIQLFAWLRDKEMLLVLDNFEHLIADATVVSELLQACPRVSVLGTSRESLHLHGEHVFPVPPLPTPRLPPGTADMLAPRAFQFSAVQLFVERARAADAAFHLDDENAAAVGEICDRLDGLPLAIELAAARSERFTPREMTAQLQHRLAFLTTGAHDLPARQHTLWNTIDWSYTLLGPREQILFRRLAVFTGGFTSAAVEAVCNADGELGHETLKHLTMLADKSLIYMMDHARNSRYNMLETLCEYAHVKLDEAGEAESVCRLHLGFFLHLAEEAETKLPSAERPLWFERLDAEQDNLASALEWAFEAEPGTALRLAVALGTMWEVRVRIFTGRAILDRALARGTNAPETWRAKALYWAGRLGLRQGDLRRARAELRTSLNMYRDLSDRSGMGFALNDLGSVAHWQGDYGEAQRLLEESLAIRHVLGNPWWIAQTLNNLGMTAYRRGDVTTAERYFGECLDYFQQTGAEMPLAWPLGGLGQVAFARGDYHEARRLLQQSADLWRKHKFSWALAFRLNDLGLLMWTIRDHAAAQHMHEESMTITREIGDQRGMSFALEGLARVASTQGDARGAVRFLGAAAAQRQASGVALGSVENAIHESIVADLRAQLGPAAFDDGWTQGAAMSPDQLLTST